VNDTGPAVKDKLLEMMQQRTEADKFLMGTSMFDTARLITRAAILEDRPDISPVEFRIDFFCRWYEEDFEPHIREKILAAIRLKAGLFETWGWLIST